MKFIERMLLIVTVLENKNQLSTMKLTFIMWNHGLNLRYTQYTLLLLQIIKSNIS